VRDDAEHPVERHLSSEPILEVGGVARFGDPLGLDKPRAGDAVLVRIKRGEGLAVAPHSVV
jgi:hypothetical protein